MKIIKAYPPNFSEIAEVFPVKGRQGILYAYGDRLFNPSGVPLPTWILDHEIVHGKRQLVLGGVKGWWTDYIVFPTFRLQEELLAHRQEWKSYREASFTQKDWDRYLGMMADRLSSPLYGNLVTREKAWSLIQGTEEL